MNWRMIFMWPVVMLAALPASSHYDLGSYGFGTGGTAGTSSSNYSINGIAGDAAGTSSSSHYAVGAGQNYQQQADAPLVALSNPGAWYNKLLMVVSPNGNPTDAKYAIAISPDNFTTTFYVRPDLTLDPSLTISDFQTYTDWGGASGSVLRGLSHGTTYTAKATATRGKYTQGAYGPASTSITTNDPSLTFDIDVSATDTSTSPPYAVSFGTLLAGSINTPGVKVWLSLDTNADSGASIYVSDQNAGLLSSFQSHTISSSSTDITSQSEGYGAQSASATQAAGGPLTPSSPFNGGGGNVGALSSLFQQMYNATAPVTTGRVSFNLKAKSSTVTPPSEDYADLLTLVAAAAF